MSSIMRRRNGGLMICDAVEANFLAGRIALSIVAFTREIEACPSASAGTRSRSGRSLLAPSAGGLEATVRKKGQHQRAALCVLATSRE